MMMRRPETDAQLEESDRSFVVLFIWMSAQSVALLMLIAFAAPSGSDQSAAPYVLCLLAHSAANSIFCIFFILKYVASPSLLRPSFLRRRASRPESDIRKMTRA